MTPDKAKSAEKVKVFTLRRLIKGLVCMAPASFLLEARDTGFGVNN
jgi:hypothetical protein